MGELVLKKVFLQWLEWIVCQSRFVQNGCIKVV